MRKPSHVKEGAISQEETLHSLIGKWRRPVAGNNRQVVENFQLQRNICADELESWLTEQRKLPAVEAVREAVLRKLRDTNEITESAYHDTGVRSDVHAAITEALALHAPGPTGERAFIRLANEGRCLICGWPLAWDGKGCVPGNCSYRPMDENEQRKIHQRRDALNAALAAAQGAPQGKEPT